MRHTVAIRKRIGPTRGFCQTLREQEMKMDISRLLGITRERNSTGNLQTEVVKANLSRIVSHTFVMQASRFKPNFAG